MPSRSDGEAVARIRDLLRQSERMVDALGLDNGPSQTASVLNIQAGTLAAIAELVAEDHHQEADNLVSLFPRPDDLESVSTEDILTELVGRFGYTLGPRAKF